ncbi:hypothetical protein [Granulicella mallensis]|jgi:hypothetical protein|uniref:Uncharacterized protein n=1 Tax=Granulicella mallensis TaxID=940614 RepID=A0A7W7ZLQ5_9BACT|nr:hypothetical protein [Granulicella mallensis]MBB5062256.1 hypothetical protein [Granulicella mallensis]
MNDLNTSIEPKHEAYVEPQMEESGENSSDLLSTAFISQAGVVKGGSTICGCCFC